MLAKSCTNESYINVIDMLFILLWNKEYKLIPLKTKAEKTEAENERSNEMTAKESL